MGMGPAEVAEKLENAKSKLWEYRYKARPSPQRDEKVSVNS